MTLSNLPLSASHRSSCSHATFILRYPVSHLPLPYICGNHTSSSLSTTSASSKLPCQQPCAPCHLLPVTLPATPADSLSLEASHPCQRTHHTPSLPKQPHQQTSEFLTIKKTGSPLFLLVIGLDTWEVSISDTYLDFPSTGKFTVTVSVRERHPPPPTAWPLTSHGMCHLRPHGCVNPD